MLHVPHHTAVISCRNSVVIDYLQFEWDELFPLNVNHDVNIVIEMVLRSAVLYNKQLDEVFIRG